jgi:4-amino-4-deoxy-L-arabinose transferase-like glycosyltransferase
MLFKAPVAAIAAVLAAIALGARWLRRDEIDLAPHAWLTWCLAVPPVAYGIVLMASGAKAGVRLAFPLLPFVMIATGLVAARAIHIYGRPARRAAVLLAAILAIECLVAWPDYIAFFNVAAGGPRGGARLLGDSNLDWGQDLKLLKSWQEANPDEKLYLVYDGSADPAGYGIRYVNAFGAYPFGPQRGPIDAPGVLAISVSSLQGLRSLPELEPMLEELKRSDPLAVLGGSIYLYRVTPPRG